MYNNILSYFKLKQVKNFKGATKKDNNVHHLHFNYSKEFKLFFIIIYLKGCLFMYSIKYESMDIGNAKALEDYNIKKIFASSLLSKNLPTKTASTWYTFIKI